MKTINWCIISGIFLLFIVNTTTVFAQSIEELQKQVTSLTKQLENLSFTFDQLEKGIDDITWFDRVGDVAYVDKVVLTGPPPRVIKNPTGQGASNPVRFSTYIFLPKKLDANKKYPLLVFPHGGVHSNFETFYTHIVRELVSQQYVVVAPDYRGSTGYGKTFHEQIDYGGLENEDVKASRDYMLENYDFIDSDRVGILGWSHGGMITLMSIFNHPKDYKVAYAGCPVSDLIARMGYKGQGYRNEYSADYHLGKSADQNVEEYRKRSPAWNAEKLQTPLLLHTNTNDEDVNPLEVEHLIQALKAEGKKFEYEIYKDIPGGHTFNRIDTKAAKESRLKIYKFLAGYLKPAGAFKSIQELQKAGYGY